MADRYLMQSVIGHGQIKEKLSLRLKEHPSGVYLFCGPASIGKRTTAFEVSRIILCCEEKSEEKCGCSSCKRYKLGNLSLEQTIMCFF